MDVRRAKQRDPMLRQALRKARILEHRQWFDPSHGAIGRGGHGERGAGCVMMRRGRVDGTHLPEPVRGVECAAFEHTRRQLRSLV